MVLGLGGEVRRAASRSLQVRNAGETALGLVE